MLTFEGQRVQGQQNIVKKLTELSFQTVQHAPQTVDCQPTPNNGILVFVSGALRVDNDTNPLKFSQAFHLLPLPTGQGYYVFNDIFRLNYG